MSTGDIAIALALLSVAAFAACFVHWRAMRWSAQPFHPWVALLCIGGALSAFGALCFAMAFLVGG